jgi:hypothetical protein
VARTFIASCQTSASPQPPPIVPQNDPSGRTHLCPGLGRRTARSGRHHDQRRAVLECLIDLVEDFVLHVAIVARCTGLKASNWPPMPQVQPAVSAAASPCGSLLEGVQESQKAQGSVRVRLQQNTSMGVIGWRRRYQEPVAHPLHEHVAECPTLMGLLKLTHRVLCDRRPLRRSAP